MYKTLLSFLLVTTQCKMGRASAFSGRGGDLRVLLPSDQEYSVERDSCTLVHEVSQTIR